MPTKPRRVFVILGNQLFPVEHVAKYRDAAFFMAEDVGLCTYERHHQQKLVLFLAAMRAHRDALENAGLDVRYFSLSIDDDTSYEDKLNETCEVIGATELVHFEIEDKPMEARLVEFAARTKLQRVELASPGFTCSRERFADYADGAKRLHMADFYRRERRFHDVLVDGDGSPVGGRWSFDHENRKKLPKNVTPPPVPPAARTAHVNEVISLVTERFSAHPGRAEDFWWPTTREQALEWLAVFLEQRFAAFGPYEDAISQRSETVYHSVLSPVLNLGLVTPMEVVRQALAVAKDGDIPLSSVEGLVRQIIGWREFIRGTYRHFSEQQEAANHWAHKRRLTEDWYEGTTGIPPLDDAIKTATRSGWTHHIQRLMVIANLMTLAEIRPRDAHTWFMEMFVDSSEWVMGPNVYGMGLFSDGGLFATKPYICGSNYLLKMSDYRKGEWCDVVDGLYWRFVARHRTFFSKQPRLALMTKALDRIPDERRARIGAAADGFLSRCTVGEAA